MHIVNSPVSLGLGQVMGPGEGASLSPMGGVPGSLSGICSGTRSWRVMCGGGSWCLLQGLRGDERLCRKLSENDFFLKARISRISSNKSIINIYRVIFVLFSIVIVIVKYLNVDKTHWNKLLYQQPRIPYLFLECHHVVCDPEISLDGLAQCLQIQHVHPKQMHG